MAQKCEITGKGKQSGNNVSFSYALHQKNMEAQSLQKKTFELVKKVTMKISTQAIRTLKSIL